MIMFTSLSQSVVVVFDCCLGTLHEVVPFLFNFGDILFRTVWVIFVDSFCYLNPSVGPWLFSHSRRKGSKENCLFFKPMWECWWLKLELPRYVTLKTITASKRVSHSLSCQTSLGLLVDAFATVFLGTDFGTLFVLAAIFVKTHTHSSTELKTSKQHRRLRLLDTVYTQYRQ